MKAHILIDTSKEALNQTGGTLGLTMLYSHAHTADLRVRGTLLRDVRGN